MEQYKQLLTDILNGCDGVNIDSRSGKTIKIFGKSYKYDLRNGFPIVTTKKVFWRGVVGELLWMLKGNTNIKELVKQKLNFWTPDAFRSYKEKVGKTNLTETEFSEKILNDNKFSEIYGDLGPVYGKQWRNFNGIDQIEFVINEIVNNPNSRRMLVSAWHPSDLNKMVLPPCHTLFQFNCTKIPNKFNDKDYYLDLHLYQRSADAFLGVPFNISSYALLLHIVAKITNTVPRHFIHTFGDLHIYKLHLPQVHELLSRDPHKLPTLKLSDNFNDKLETLYKQKINTETINVFLSGLCTKDFKLKNYIHHKKINAQLSVG